MASANDPGQREAESTQQSGQGQTGRNGGSRASQQLETRGGGQQRQRDMRESGGGGRSVAGGRQEDLSTLSGNPFELMWDLSRQMDRMMSSMFRSFGSGFLGSSFPSTSLGGSSESGFAPTVWSPRIDVEQRGDALMVCADLPGVRKEDVTIDLTEEGLTIAGERREEREEGGKEQGYRAIERSYGRFYRKRVTTTVLTSCALFEVGPRPVMQAVVDHLGRCLRAGMELDHYCHRLDGHGHGKQQQKDQQ